MDGALDCFGAVSLGRRHRQKALGIAKHLQDSCVANT
jgi:hypothetical protein